MSSKHNFDVAVPIPRQDARGPMRGAHGTVRFVLHRLHRFLPSLIAIRDNDFFKTALATLMGAITGLLVFGVSFACQTAHEILFAIPHGMHLSAVTAIVPWRALLVPSAGGILLSLLVWGLGRLTHRRAVDPIEANALHGGRMSLGDSAGVIAQIMISNSCGASVGLEAAYTQLGGAVASRLGRLCKLRREDLRLLVGCGTAAAITAAFNAPMMGAFYAFELVLGAYRISSLAPVAGACIAAITVTQMLTPDGAQYFVLMPSPLSFAQFLPPLAMGVISATIGISLMRMVTTTEILFLKLRLPFWLRPLIGGLCVGVLAVASPMVMSGGHGILRQDFGEHLAAATLCGLIAMKILASAISLGSGFRGGLLFASLLLGGLFGKMFAQVMGWLPPQHVGMMLLPQSAFTIIGMSSLATAVIGGPMAMTFLAIETTRNLSVGAVALAANMITSLLVRQFFGYSFATWRFHLRGEAIKSPADIGWVRNLTVDRMMRRNVPIALVTQKLEAFCHDYPLGGAANRVVAVDEQNHYRGIVWVSEAHNARRQNSVTGAEAIVADIMHTVDHVLYPALSVKDALDMFADAQVDTLAVVETRARPRVTGFLNEYYALRRYTEELEKRGRELTGE